MTDVPKAEVVETKSQRLERFRKTLRLGREQTFRLLGEIVFNAAFEVDRDDLPKLLAMSNQLGAEATERARRGFDAAIPDAREQLREAARQPLVDAMHKAAVELAKAWIHNRDTVEVAGTPLFDLEEAFVTAVAALAAHDKAAGEGETP